MKTTKSFFSYKVLHKTKKTNNFLNHNSTARNCDAQHIKHIKTHFLRAKSPSITQPEEKYFMAHLLCVTPTNLYNT